jgi:hypothetical protein
MKKTIKLAFLFIAISFLSCKKEVITVPSCPTGKIRLTSNSSNPYNLYIDGVLKNKVAGYAYIEYDLPEGSHTFKAEQVSGYVLYPTVKSSTIAIFGCKDTEWIFP